MNDGNIDKEKKKGEREQGQEEDIKKYLFHNFSFLANITRFETSVSTCSVRAL